MPPGCVQAEFAPPAQLVKTDCREGPDEREACSKWVKIGSEIIFEGHGGPERIDFKRKLYEQLDELLPPDVIIASISSGLIT